MGLKQRATYSNRIEELRNTDLLYHCGDAKALPRPPAQGRDSQHQEALPPFRDEDARREAPPAFASQARIPSEPQVHRDPPMMAKTHVPPRRQSSLPPVFRYEERSLQAPRIAQMGPQQQMQYQTWINLDYKDRTRKPPLTLEPPLFSHYIPPPLSPVNSAEAPATFVEEHPIPAKQSTTPPVINNELSDSNNADQENAEFTSWLDTIDESGNSTSSSVHSRSSSLGLRRKRIRAASGATEAEFDAALDAAVEVAYDDGFEPDDDEEEQMSQNIYSRSTGQRFVSDARKNVEIAKEMVREAEREAAILLAKDREMRRLQEKWAERDSIDMDYGDDEEEEEERMLEEMTRDYIMDDSEYDVQSKSALPRQSDSSGFSGRTWASSISNPTTAGTPLSTVAEFPPQPQAKAALPPSHPPPMGALPPPPGAPTTASPTISNGAESRPPSVTRPNPGVRERRLSGKMKHLKIETNTRVANNSEPPPSGQPVNQAPRTGPMQTSFGASKPSYGSTEPQKGTPDLSFSPPSASTSHSFSRRDMLHSNGYGFVDGSSSYPVSASLTRAPTGESETSAHSIPSSPGRFASKAVGLRKNFSSSSLRSKGMITASGSDVFESSPTTPSTATHSYSNRKGSLSTTIPILPTPTGASFMIDRPATGGMYLFESDIHSPTAPGSPNPLAANAPLPLEPCPDSPLLRPFWFLRCIYQTIAHPRGAYISTKLFIPRDIWRVRGIKLKGIEEKISQCDLLSAALQKLSKVDTLNADAVLEEMQFLENVMDQAQANLAKKLGSDVGVIGASALFKSPSIVEEVVLNNNDNAISKASGANNRSYLSSWRKLRSKGSAAPGPTPATTGPNSREGSREGPTMDSLPMTSMSDPRFFKRDLSRVEYGGPNANYMAALARLCDAVQVLGKYLKSSNCKISAFSVSLIRIFSVLHRSDRSPGGRSRTQAYLANTCWPRTQHAPRVRVLWTLYLPVLACRCEHDARQIY